MAALLLVGGVLFALQATAVTPLSASTSNQHIQNQHATLAKDLLATAAANGTLREAAVFWNASAGGFVNASESGYYVGGGPPTAFGRALDEVFRERRVAFNVYVRYRTDSGRRSQRMVYTGSPSDNAVAASRTVVVFNDTRLSDGSGRSLANVTGSFYAPDVDPGGALYNVLEVRIVAWRM